jgi:hypothetical protein
MPHTQVIRQSGRGLCWGATRRGIAGATHCDANGGVRKHVGPFVCRYLHILFLFIAVDCPCLENPSRGTLDPVRETIHSNRTSEKRARSTTKSRDHARHVDDCAESCLPLFSRFAGTMASSDFSSTYMRRAACRLPEPTRHTSPGMDETSQVPCKELLHVHKVSDCARFFPCKPARHGTILPSLQRNEIGTSELDPFRSSVLGPWPPL